MILLCLGMILVVSMLPSTATAHGGLPGGGGFYSGAAHPFLAVEQFLVLLGLGLILGQASGANSRLPLLVLAAALFAGLVAGPAYGGTELMLLSLALFLGSILAAALRVHAFGIIFAALLTGWIVGASTDVPPATLPDIFARLAPFAGVVVGVFLIVLNAAALASASKRPAAIIGFRIAGSWIAAIAVLVLTLRFHVDVVTG